MVGGRSGLHSPALTMNAANPPYNARFFMSLHVTAVKSLLLERFSTLLDTLLERADSLARRGERRRASCIRTATRTSLSGRSA